ncbi:MAG: ABC transporter permease [Bacteroidia bacterium]|nr:ABC transporter permease [Bacteroidia bacterium]
MIRNYFLVALRNLWRNKFFSLVNILGLSVGIACCLIIFLYAKNELSYDQFHERKDNIYQLVADMTNPNGEVQKLSVTGMMPGPGFKKQLPEIQEYVRIQNDNFIVKKNNEVFDQELFYCDETFFSVFSFPLLKGNPNTALKDMHSVVLSEKTALKYFGKENPIGQRLEMNTGRKTESFIVSGVMKDAPKNSSIKPEMMIPMKFSQSQYDDVQWGNFFLNTFFLIKPGTDLTKLETKFNSIYQREAAEQIKEMAEKYGMKDKIVFKLQPLLKMHLSEDYPATNGLADASKPVYSYILSGIALFVLLIASFNFINLTVARSLKRSKEIGIRKAIGSLRSQLVIQFLGESFVICMVAFLFAILLVQLLLPFFNTVSDRSLSFSYLFDLKLVLGFVSLFLLTGLLAGFYPALVLSRFKPVETLYGKLKYSGKNYISKVLVVVQFTLSIFLIIATVTIYRQFNFLVDFDLGYDDSNILTVSTPSLTKEKLVLLKTELLKYPVIKKVSGMQDGTNITMARVNGEQEMDFDIKRVDEDYLKTMKISLVAGRDFSKAFPGDSVNSILVNETFAKKAGWKNALGKEVDFFYRNKKFKIVGVFKDYHFSSLNGKIMPELLHMNQNFNSYRKVLIKLKPGVGTSDLAFISEIFKKFYPEKPYTYSFKNEDNQKQYDNEAKWKKIITFSAVLAIFISCVGLFALAVLSSERRAREIGIRKVLGASVRVIVRHLTFDFLVLILVASCIAVPLTWWLMNKWLQNYPYHIELKLTVFCFTVIIVLLIAFFTISFQSVKTALSNPIKSLRTE